MKSHRRPHEKKPPSHPSLLERMNPNAAGVDCGSEARYAPSPLTVTQPPCARSRPTRQISIASPTGSRPAASATVAMESTGVYWIPLYEILEARGLDVVLVNARHVKNVPGRKTDVVDCQWIQELHSVGLLRGSFRPTAAIAALRAYLRHRETLVQSAATHVQRMQKALVQMNLQLPVVISDITGVTGLRILRDIVAGVPDPHALAQHRDHRCRPRRPRDRGCPHLGHYRPEHVFVLQQHLELYDTYQRQLAACDAAIETHVQTLAAQAPAPAARSPARRGRSRATMSRDSTFDPAPPADRRRSHPARRHRPLQCPAAARRDWHRHEPLAHRETFHVLADPGAPQQNLRRPPPQLQTQPSANRAAGILRMAAMSLGRTETALGAFYRRLAYRVGKAKAITATARQPRHPRLPHAQGWPGVPDTGGRRVRRPNTARASFAACASRAANLGFTPRRS